MLSVQVMIFCIDFSHWLCPVMVVYVLFIWYHKVFHVVYSQSFVPLKIHSFYWDLNGTKVV